MSCLSLVARRGVEPLALRAIRAGVVAVGYPHGPPTAENK